MVNGDMSSVNPFEIFTPLFSDLSRSSSFILVLLPLLLLILFPLLLLLLVLHLHKITFLF